ncbi:galactosidase beta 1 like 2 S homeolog [Xenopus laevis]|uniref:Beta-galactosidase n=1 Tax=Xenopus laevis TaxID=8355 RepID=Q7ZWP0_XENLA|nr:galactosidase beta 1 like 2 S homeolog [Xenopus laevis]AAH46858.1 Loc89944-prov protein [Xenopus laevis]
MRRDLQRRRMMVLILLFIAAFLMYRLSLPSHQNSFMMLSPNSGLLAEDSHFLLNGIPYRILGGSMHYFRVPMPYWRDRMKKMKACGINTLTTYVPWNLHEPRKGKFDFSKDLDISEFLAIASEMGLWVILRPGPYICAEWDLGGLPSWLLRDKDMKLRTTYRGFTEATEAYLDELIPRIAKYQYSNGGPIIAVQVENEYGSYAKDANYMEFIKNALVEKGIVELLLTSDNKDGLSSGSLENVLATVNFQKIEPVLFSYLNSIQSNKPVMVMEFWTGWFDYWGGKHHIFDVDEMISTVSEVLNRGASINLYMFHGGTNFGFMNGALHFHEYRPDITSYDYDAPLTEAGDYTSKYFKLRELFGDYNAEKPLPPVPSLTLKTSYGAVELKRCLPLWEVLHLVGEPFKSAEPVNMENLPVNDGNGQSYGYTLYETIIYGGGQFHSKGNVRDRAQVFASSQSFGTVDYKKENLHIPEIPAYRKLAILVENCGRVNYGPMIDKQHKGLVGDVYLRNKPLRNFKTYSLEMNSTFISSINEVHWSDLSDCKTGPTFYQGALNVVGSPTDTFLRMKGWKKGVVFVNSKNLGRYWDIGPQETLFIPGPWLWPGVNEITLFEEYEAGQTLFTVDTPILGKMQYVE